MMADYLNFNSNCYWFPPYRADETLVHSNTGTNQNRLPKVVIKKK
jgi:hypothetical protein